MISPKQRRRLCSALLAAALLTALPAQAAAAENWEPGAEYAAEADGQTMEDMVPTGVIPPLPITLRRSSDHQKYMDGYEDGTFRPNAPLTRAELAQMLYAVIEERPEKPVSYPDVPETVWYCRAAGTLGALRLMGGGLFLPEQPVTRAECAVVLAKVLWYEPGLEALPQRTFPDVPETHWAYAEISRAASWGLFAGDEAGNFSPDSLLTRAETVTVFNRLLGRAADRAELSSRGDLRRFPDVPVEFWAYGEIMEATVAHAGVPDDMGRETWAGAVAERTVLADGCHVIDGSVYRVMDGMFLCGAWDGYLSYDANGRAVFSGSPVELIRQRPELLNGCEVTSLAMVMASVGCPVDKVDLYWNYLPKADFYYQGSVRYGPDPEEYYVGNAAARGGWYCFEGPVAQAGSTWLANCGSRLRAVPFRDMSREGLDAYVRAGIPVIAWVTTNYGAPKLSTSSWRLADGTLYRPYTNLHCVVVTGLSGGKYQIADPISGMRTLERDKFWSCFSAMGGRAVVVLP